MNQDAIALALAGVMPAARATGLFVSLATFQNTSGVLDDSGFPNRVYVDVAGLTNIPCTAPPSPTLGGIVQAQEIKSAGEILSFNWSHVLLDGFYPDAEIVWRNGGQVVIDDEVFPHSDLLGVESDSQSRMTRIQIRVATV